MKIAFVSEFDADDIRSWSGTPYHMKRVCERFFEAVEYIRTPFHGDLEGPVERKLREIGAFVSTRLKNSDADAVVCQGNSGIPFLRYTKPVVYWHDSTWYALSGTDFDNFSRLRPRLKKWDQQALNRCSLAIFASQWIAQGVLDHYEIPSYRVRVLPFGSNFEGFRQADTTGHCFRSKPGDRCKLAFVGVNWRGKGLPAAVALTEYLNGPLGLKSELTVIGCHPPHPSVRSSAFVRVEGFLDKSDPASRVRFENILRETHFLVHPALFECFGCALVEANSFGIPVVATNVGGIPTIVRRDVNGRLFSPARFVKSGAHFIRECINRYDEVYGKLSLSSFDEYRRRLSWDVNGAKLRDLLVQL